MSRAAMQQALEALEEIALAGMSGSGQESEEGMRDWHARQAWKFIGIAARALEPLRAALEAPQPRQGWVLVPEEPTPEMLRAGEEHVAIGVEVDHHSRDIAANAYRAMLAARLKETT